MAVTLTTKPVEDVSPSGRRGPARASRSRVQRAAVWALPLSLLVLIPFFYAPLAGLLVRPLQPDDGGSAFSAYERVLTTGHLLKTVGQSFEIAGLSFGLMLLLGYPLAYLIRFRVPPQWRLPVLMLLVLAGSISDIVRIYSWYALLGTNGIINKLFMGVGITDAPIDGLLFSRFSVVLVLTAGWLPYVVIPIYSSMRSIDQSVIEASRDLYAGRFALFRSVLLPMSAPGILGAFIIVFVPVLSDFATPALVGGPSSLMVGNFVSDQLLQVGDWPTAAAAASLLLVVSLLLVAAAQWATRRLYGR
ncbi:ABC transporter permease [Nocardioides bigeumensis]|uniref:ABC transporter permease n=1 Tax=Nocardioides bigeumensis TaxID=433657 RepID=A0ABP5KM96_9ACTN